MKEKLLYESESYAIRGACFKIYKEFGGVFKESVINKALEIELKQKGLLTENQKRIDIVYSGKKIGVYIPDLIINNEILIELKTKPFITKEDEKQFWRYLKFSDYKLGFLINFGSQKLEIKRRVYDKARDNIIVNPLLRSKDQRKSASTEGGQVLLLSVLVLSGVIISTSFFVGYLMVQRLKQAVLTIDSAQAFYLADSGVEFELYKVLKNNNNFFACPKNLAKDAEIDSSIEISPDSQSDDINLGLVIKSTGHIKNIGRNYDVSRSQMDFSQSIPRIVLCGDPTQTDYNQDICILPDGGNNLVKQTISTNSKCETDFNKF